MGGLPFTTAAWRIRTELACTDRRSPFFGREPDAVTAEVVWDYCQERGLVDTSAEDRLVAAQAIASAEAVKEALGALALRDLVLAAYLAARKALPIFYRHGPREFDDPVAQELLGQVRHALVTGRFEGAYPAQCREGAFVTLIAATVALDETDIGFAAFRARSAALGAYGTALVAAARTYDSVLETYDYQRDALAATAGEPRPTAAWALARAILAAVTRRMARKAAPWRAARRR